MGAATDEVWTWTGFPGGMLRPLTEAETRRSVRILVAMFGTATAVGIPAFFGWVTAPGLNNGLLALGLVPAAIGTLLYVRVLRGSAESLRRRMPWVAMLGLPVALLGVSVAVVAVGPRLGVVAVYFVEAPLMVFFVLRFRWALAWTALMLAAYAVALSFVDGATLPGLQWATVLTSAALCGLLIGGTASRLDNAQQNLAAVNARFRRFLAPQVADVLTTGEDALAPHYSDIAVFFVDLRGFTAFTNASEPETVVRVLDEYYAAVGTVVDRYNGTIGGFDGDGVFAFLGDPIPNQNAPADAIAMAKEIATELDNLTPNWGGLGYGMGLAFGKATVGLVGFEGRLDYTPVGACVNLAARLCADAKHGEIVIDESLKASAPEACARDAVELKGFGLVKTFGVSH